MSNLFSGAHTHLLANHAPVFGVLFALALLASSLVWAPDVLRRTAFVVLVGTAVAAAVANYSGDPAEDAIRGFPGVRRELIHDHEEMGKVSFMAAGALGLLALGALWRWRRSPVPNVATGVVFLGAATVSAMLVYTALLGGRIRHTEVRPGASPADATVIEPPRMRPPPSAVR
jgi:hypothetical protein